MLVTPTIPTLLGFGKIKTEERLGINKILPERIFITIHHRTFFNLSLFVQKIYGSNSVIVIFI